MNVWMDVCDIVCKWKPKQESRRIKQDEWSVYSRRKAIDAEVEETAEEMADRIREKRVVGRATRP